MPTVDQYLRKIARSQPDTPFWPRNCKPWRGLNGGVNYCPSYRMHSLPSKSWMNWPACWWLCPWTRKKARKESMLTSVFPVRMNPNEARRALGNGKK